MANIFDKDISYITEEEVKETTAKQQLKDLDNQDVKLLISQAEDIVNNYLGYKIKLDNNNTYDIKKATFYCVEQIFESGDMISGATSGGSGAVVSERTGDRQVNYDVGTQTTTNKFKLLGIPDQAKVILDKYKKVFFKQVI